MCAFIYIIANSQNVPVIDIITHIFSEELGVLTKSHSWYVAELCMVFCILTLNNTPPQPSF